MIPIDSTCQAKLSSLPKDPRNLLPKHFKLEKFDLGRIATPRLDYQGTPNR